MVRRVLTLVGVACVLSGCAHVHRIDPASSDADREELNQTLEGRQARVELRASQRHPFGAALVAENVRVGVDSTLLTVLRDPGDITSVLGRPRYAAGQDTTLMTSAILRISTHSGLRGIRDGAFVGALAGAAFGAILGAFANDSWFGPGEYALGFGVLGVGVGSLIGGVRGSTEIHEFSGK